MSCQWSTGLGEICIVCHLSRKICLRISYSSVVAYFLLWVLAKFRKLASEARLTPTTASKIDSDLQFGEFSF